MIVYRLVYCRVTYGRLWQQRGIRHLHQASGEVNTRYLTPGWVSLPDRTYRKVRQNTVSRVLRREATDGVEGGTIPDSRQLDCQWES